MRRDFVPKVLYFNLQEAFDGNYEHTDGQLDKTEKWILEPTDIPMWGTFGWEEEGWTMRMYLRRGLCTHDETQDYIGCIVSGEYSHWARWPQEDARWSDWELTMVNMTECVQKLIRCLHGEHKKVLAAASKSEDKGLYFKIEEAGYLYPFEVSLVSGKKRPDLYCELTEKLRGRMYRPYPDEAEIQPWRVRAQLQESLKKAESGDLDAMFDVSDYYRQNKPFEPAQPEKAFYWCRTLAENEAGDAGYQTMLMCGKGYGTPRDFVQMAHWMQRYEGNKRIPDDMRNEVMDAAGAQAKGEQMDSRDLITVAKAILWMREYMPHVGPEQDCQDALELARKAVALGNADGYALIGQAYEMGRGLEKDAEKAMECYQKAVEAGSPVGMLELGRVCHDGDLVTRDLGGAFTWTLKAAEKEYLPAMKNLAFLYYEGTGTEKNLDEAEFWAKAYLDKRQDAQLHRLLSNIEFDKKMKGKKTIWFGY